MHIRLAQRERVDVRVVIQVREAVIDEAVRDLVAAYGVDDVNHLRVGFESPIVLGNLGCGVVYPAGNTSGFEVFNAPRTRRV